MKKFNLSKAAVVSVAIGLGSLVALIVYMIADKW